MNNYGMMNGNGNINNIQLNMNGINTSHSVSMEMVTHQPEDERLELVVQTSPFEEKVTRNGLQKIIRVVIKNSPFNVQLKLRKSTTEQLDLNHVAFESTLLYDHDTNDEKEVDFVKCKPVEHKATPSEQGDIVNVELRIKVLTSQHEDMFFRVKIEGLDPISKQPIKNLSCLTNPIKVISKPEQLKKKQPPKKRTWNDILLESVSKIQQQQNEQQKLIEKLIDYNVKTTNPTNILSGTTTLISSGGANTALLGGTGVTIPSNNNNILGTGLTKTEFEDSFKQMMSAYTLLDPRQRAEKVRRVFRNASSRDSETLSELLDLFITEGVGGPLGTIAPLPVQTNTPTINMNTSNTNNTNNNNNNNNNNTNIISSSSGNIMVNGGSPHLHSSQHGNGGNVHLPHSTQPNPFLHHQNNTNTNNQNNNNQNNNNNNNNPNDYPFFSTIPTSFDNEFNSFGSNSDFNPF